MVAIIYDVERSEHTRQNTLPYKGRHTGYISLFAVEGRRDAGLGDAQRDAAVSRLQRAAVVGAVPAHTHDTPAEGQSSDWNNKLIMDMTIIGNVSLCGKFIIPV